MNCSRFRHWLEEEAAGGSRGRVWEGEIVQHLQACEKCSRNFAMHLVLTRAASQRGLARILERHQRGELEPVPAGVAERVRERFEGRLHGVMVALTDTLVRLTALTANLRISQARPAVAYGFREKVAARTPSELVTVEGPAGMVAGLLLKGEGRHQLVIHVNLEKSPSPSWIFEVFRIGLAESELTPLFSIPQRTGEPAQVPRLSPGLYLLRLIAEGGHSMELELNAEPTDSEDQQR